VGGWAVGWVLVGGWVGANGWMAGWLLEDRTTLLEEKRLGCDAWSWMVVLLMSTGAERQRVLLPWQMPKPTRLPPKHITPTACACRPAPCCSEEEGEGHEEFDQQQLREHEEFTKVKNIEKIELGRYEMETWYYSPFPPEYRDCRVRGLVGAGEVGGPGVGGGSGVGRRGQAALPAAAASPAFACCSMERGSTKQRSERCISVLATYPALCTAPAPCTAPCTACLLPAEAVLLRVRPAVLQAPPPDAAPPAQGQAAAPPRHRDLQERKHLYV
jgi:hypothetical protein